MKNIYVPPKYKNKKWFDKRTWIEKHDGKLIVLSIICLLIGYWIFFAANWG